MVRYGVVRYGVIYGKAGHDMVLQGKVWYGVAR